MAAVFYGFRSLINVSFIPKVYLVSIPPCYRLSVLFSTIAGSLLLQAQLVPMQASPAAPPQRLDQSMLASRSAAQPITRNAQLTTPQQIAQTATNRPPSELELAIVAELNQARTNPVGYAAWLETQRQYYSVESGTFVLRLPGESPTGLREGEAALISAIASLQQLEPRTPLTFSDLLTYGVQDWVNAIGSQGATGGVDVEGNDQGFYTRNYGLRRGAGFALDSYRRQQAAAIVLAWIVNDGDPTRSIRQALLTPELTQIGVACGDHLTRDVMCSISVAQEFSPLTTPSPQNSVTNSVTTSLSAPTGTAPTGTAPTGTFLSAPTGTVPVQAAPAQAISQAVTVPVPSPHIAASSSAAPATSASMTTAASMTTPVMSVPMATPPTTATPGDTVPAPHSQLYGLDAPLSTPEAFAQGIIDETNRMRANPAAYASELVTLLDRFNGNNLEIPELGIAYETYEGTFPVYEAIEELRQTPSLPTLSFQRGLSQAAQAHVTDMGLSGYAGHIGTDGSKPLDRALRFGRVRGLIGENISYQDDRLHSPQWHILMLLVDDNVPDRGHRRALLNPEYQVTGAACGVHLSFGNLCVMTYADGFDDADNVSNVSAVSER